MYPILIKIEIEILKVMSYIRHKLACSCNIKWIVRPLKPTQVFTSWLLADLNPDSLDNRQASYHLRYQTFVLNQSQLASLALTQSNFN